MKLEDFIRYMSEGLEANSWRRFYFTAIELQVHWIAFLGQPRWHFVLTTILGLPATVLCFWIGYMTNLASQDTEGWSLLSILIWAAIVVPAKLMPVVYPIYLIVCLITGAFFKEFWECVARIKAENTPE